MNEETNGVAEAGGRGNRRRWAVWIALGVLGIGALGFWALQYAEIVDPPEDTLRVENRTNETIVVYHRLADGSETPSHIFPEIEAGSSFTVYLTCGSGSLAARTEDGELVDTRGPFEECNLEDWIIEAPGG